MGARSAQEGLQGLVCDPPLGFRHRTVPHITLSCIAQNVAPDPIFVRHEPVRGAALALANKALTTVPTKRL